MVGSDYDTDEDFSVWWHTHTHTHTKRKSYSVEPSPGAARSPSASHKKKKNKNKNKQHKRRETRLKMLLQQTDLKNEKIKSQRDVFKAQMSFRAAQRQEYMDLLRANAATNAKNQKYGKIKGKGKDHKTEKQQSQSQSVSTFQDNEKRGLILKPDTPKQENKRDNLLISNLKQTKLIQEDKEETDDENHVATFEF